MSERGDVQGRQNIVAQAVWTAFETIRAPINCAEKSADQMLICVQVFLNLHRVKFVGIECAPTWLEQGLILRCRLQVASRHF